MKVLVIGGLGFVGSEICHQLNSIDNIEIYIIDNESKGSISNIEGIKYTLFSIDITNLGDISAAFSEIKPELVLHLAAMHFIPDCNKDPIKCLTTNIIGTENILQTLRKTKSVNKVIITSSQAVYPIKDNPNAETDPAIPSDVYGESKYANEFQAKRFFDDTGIDTFVVRLANVYGPRETNPHVLPEIMDQLVEGKLQISLGNIEPERDFIFTSDVAKGFLSLAFNNNISGFDIVNIGSGKEFSIREIINRLSTILKKEITYKKDVARFRITERMHLVADIQRIYKKVGWQPEISLDRGLEDLCKWYKLI